MINHLPTLMGTLIQPDVLQHVENLRRQIGALHIKLSQIGLQ